jgi:hypothetical protein
VEDLRAVDWLLLGATGVVAGTVAALARWTGRLAKAAQGAAGDEHLRELEHLRRELERVRADQGRLADQLTRCVQRVGMVRYDAFPGSGGRLSFSVALLDARGDGVVLSVLHGRDGSYAYAKTLRDGRPSHPLSEEEQQAVAQALAG